MSESSAHPLPPFWLMLLIGWAPVIAISVSTMAGRHDALLNQVLFLLGYMLGTIPLGLIHRDLWRRRVAWKRSVPIMLVLSLLVALAMTMLLVWVATGIGTVASGSGWHHVFGSLASMWFVLLASLAVIMVVDTYVSMQQEQRRADAAVAMARDAELRALRYQLQPHFLFNALNAISTLVLEEHIRGATRMIARLGDFLRATLHGSGAHEVALVEELTLTECYLDIEKARLGERLTVELRIGKGTPRASVPWLLLQPLVENAIQHGIAPRRGAGRLLIESQRVGGNLSITIVNDGPPAALRKNSTPDEDSPAIGLRNVRKRLQRLYGQAHRFEVAVRTDGCHEVRIQLPFRTTDDEKVHIT